jgi:hypothetical protein
MMQGQQNFKFPMNACLKLLNQDWEEKFQQCHVTLRISMSPIFLIKKTLSWKRQAYFPFKAANHEFV